jgi:hypothetical protein
MADNNKNSFRFGIYRGECIPKVNVGFHQLQRRARVDEEQAVGLRLRVHLDASQQRRSTATYTP